MARSKNFFIKEPEGIYTVTNEFFNDIESRDEALMLAIRAVDEIQLTLRDEALEGVSVLIGSIKVTTGLQRSLDELSRRWPGLLEQMYSTPRCIDGRVISIN